MGLVLITDELEYKLRIFSQNLGKITAACLPNNGHPQGLCGGRFRGAGILCPQQILPSAIEAFSTCRKRQLAQIPIAVKVTHGARSFHNRRMRHEKIDGRRLDFAGLVGRL